ncbi:two-component system, NarL family, competent response regulator ComA [Paenibacillus sp. UNCCL117]|uniref:response regulator transcription factor n=1 Tax=unclassified Paenibacillus TaxID=185978 RepID=UPI0008907290|nr:MULTISPECIES: response regulator transcription factor [unclassified Paenibacillus]SDC06690.1 two component transcriptional regulator, LuxR family [Paenibacillus sp. cl123]SFW37876.1 two-component system, NarL family, competent response regulator ComA [Paenibacillus sp. UNCCL117]
MSEMIKALVVDDHPLVANATKTLLEDMGHIKVIGTVPTARQCMEQASLYQPDLVFLDYHLPDQPGTEVAAWLKSRYPAIHIVIFTGVELTGILDKLIEIRVSGVLSKESGEHTIRNMVSCILDGHTMLPLSIYHRMQMNSGYAPEDERLEEEEILMMNLMVKGATHEQIAARIHMSKRTVDNYLRKIYAKLGVKSRVEALEKFITSKYYTQDEV